MQAQPLVSVVMPAHQSARWIESAITSVLTQTHRELELLVVDDASTDRTPDVIASMHDSRVRYVRLAQRVGCGGALNAGLALAQGELVARLDADDLALSDRLARQVDHLRRHPDVGLVGANLHILDDAGRVLGRAVMWQGRELHHALLRHNVIFHPSVMLRRAILPPTFYPSGLPRSEDWLLWVELVRAGHRLDNMVDTVGIYRRHRGAITYGPPRVTIARPFGAHLAALLGLSPRVSTTSAWIGPFTAGAVEDPAELADLARRLAPDTLPTRALGAAPPWTPRGLRRARRAHLRHLVAIVRAALAAGRRDVAWHLAPLLPVALARALRLPRLTA